MKLVTVKMPEIYMKGIEELVKARRYSSRSEVIRIAVRELLKRELWGTGFAGFPEPLQNPVYAGYRPRILRGVGIEEDEEELEGLEAIELETA